jgi:outer membrane immunogenic protein
VDWLATLRGRVGFVPADWLMIYGTGGVAFAEVETSLTYQNDHPIGLTAIDIVSTLACPGLSVCFSGSEKETLTGWTAGGGFELALGGKASLKGEYLFVDLGSHSVRAGGVSPLTTPDNAISTRVDTELHVGRVGINFQLD